MTVGVKTETLDKVDAICDQMAFKKQQFVSRALDYIVSLPDYELATIYHGHMTAQRRKAAFETQVMDALKKIQAQKSDQQDTPPAKTKRHGSGD